MLPSNVQKWAQDLANCIDADLRLEFYRIQWKLPQLIHKDVCNKEGMFYGGDRPPTRQEVEDRLEI
jgi:hypothetical protein